jgi:hypothetical protein
MNVRVIGWGGMDWLHLAHHFDCWKAVVFGFHKMLEKFVLLRDWLPMNKGSAPRS